MSKPSVLFVDDYIDTDLVEDHGLPYLCLFTAGKLCNGSSASIKAIEKCVASKIGDFDYARAPYEAFNKMCEKKYDIVCMDGGFDWVWEEMARDINGEKKCNIPGCVLPISNCFSRNRKTETAIAQLGIPHFELFSGLYNIDFKIYYDTEE
jgi:hypothetical protein